MDAGREAKVAGKVVPAESVGWVECYEYGAVYEGVRLVNGKDRGFACGGEK